MQSPSQPQSRIPWYYKPWIVIALLFLVLGPFGLPLVFKNPYFGRRAKVFLTVATLAYTAYLIWGTIKIIQAILNYAALLP